MVSVAEHCRKLEYLNLAECSKLDDEALLANEVPFRRLRSLDISGCTRFTDVAVHKVV